jgi:hypothetical protein
MPDSADFQRAFGALLAEPERSCDPALKRALAVHLNTSMKAAMDALAANFPVARALVGDDAFAACSQAFVKVAPPVDPRLCYYGGEFPGFLETWRPFSELLYLKDVASLERNVVLALFAADTPLLDPAQAAAEVNSDFALVPHPATHLISSQWPIADLWNAHQDDSPPRELQELRWTPQTALVTRPASAVEVRAVDEPTLAFLGRSSLFEAAIAADEFDGADVGAIFSNLLAAGAYAAQHY